MSYRFTWRTENSFSYFSLLPSESIKTKTSGTQCPMRRDGRISVNLILKKKTFCLIGHKNERAKGKEQERKHTNGEGIR